ncbi:MAG: tRNA dihydrouridine synthase DusB [Alphaproteobacteria bacterium]|nr:tRNA dihydrouridine synthase DusB [Alphaproteobacteria bacterium]
MSDFLSKLSSNVFLAPMAGVTDKPFRQMMRQFGKHLLYDEMVAATSYVYGSKTTERMMDLSDEKAPIAIQLVGNNPEHMAMAAKKAEQNGAFLVDINMGCPVRKLISNTSGAALMQSPILAAEIVEAVKKAVSIPVTVKMRLGWDKEHINVKEFALYMEQAGADAVTIHARTKADGYSGKADWSKIAEVKQVLSIPVIANGDIVDEQTAKNCRKQTLADGLMIGRGALGRPWILAQIDGQEPPSDIEPIVQEHFDRLLSYYGRKGLFIARKHLAWYASGHSFVANFRQSVYNETKPENVKALIREFFGN